MVWTRTCPICRAELTKDKPWHPWDCRFCGWPRDKEAV